uniref:kelch domain-containing protein 8B-like isoform X3 n=1 Tax=Pristiophorus japonicus TaxID=55135 RepID=UPI00398EE0BD
MSKCWGQERTSRRLARGNGAQPTLSEQTPKQSEHRPGIRVKTARRQREMRFLAIRRIVSRERGKTLSPQKPFTGNDGRVYALGGMGSDAAPQALVRVYDPARDHWQPLPPMPTPQYAASAFLKGNKIYVLGGRQGKLPVTAFEALDLETKSWTKYPSIPSRRAFANCAMTEKCFYSLGGLQQPGPHNFYSRPHFVNTVEVFDIEQGNWTKQSRSTRMREKRADFSVGHIGGRVIAAGGLGNQPVPLGSVEGFNPTKRKWESLPAMNTPRCSCASLQIDNMLFVIGGVAQGPSNAVEALCDRESI